MLKNERTSRISSRRSKRTIFCIEDVCGFHPDEDSASKTESSASAASIAGPAKPVATADETIWGNYLAEQGKLHGKDVAMRPNIYVIPAGNDMAAVTRRENQVEAVAHSIGPVLMPGGMLILGGPDSKQTTTFVMDVSKHLKQGSLRGIVVLVVIDASDQAVTSDALKSSGAVTRFVLM